MSVSSVNYNLNSSYGAYVQRLTAATREKLLELNIPFNENTTESEARALINNYIAKKQESSKKIATASNFNDKNNDDLLEKAKKLAQRLGISFDENADIKQILSLIESTLENRINVNKTNVQALRQLREFSNELAFLQAQCNGSSGYDNTNQALMMSLEMLSEYNKNFLNK